MANGTKSGCGISVTPRPLFTPGKDPVPIVQEAEWALGPVWTGAENLAPPPGFDPRTVQPTASRYTDWATWPIEDVGQSGYTARRIRKLATTNRSNQLQAQTALPGRKIPWFSMKRSGWFGRSKENKNNMLCCVLNPNSWPTNAIPSICRRNLTNSRLNYSVQRGSYKKWRNMLVADLAWLQPISYDAGICGNLRSTLYRVFNLKVDRTLIWVIYLLRFTTCYITQLNCIYSKCWKWCPFISMHLSTCFTIFLATFLSVLSFP
jgi:hypothetical protein